MRRDQQPGLNHTVVMHYVAFVQTEAFSLSVQILLEQGTDVPSEYMDLVRRLVSVDPRSEGPSWCEVLDTLDRLLREAA